MNLLQYDRDHRFCGNYVCKRGHNQDDLRMVLGIERLPPSGDTFFSPYADKMGQRRQP